MRKVNQKKATIIVVNQKGRFVTDEQKQLGEKYPEAKRRYLDFVKNGDYEIKASTVLPVSVEEDKKVFLVFAQTNCGKTLSIENLDTEGWYDAKRKIKERYEKSHQLLSLNEF